MLSRIVFQDKKPEDQYCETCKTHLSYERQGTDKYIHWRRDSCQCEIKADRQMDEQKQVRELQDRRNSAMKNIGLPPRLLPVSFKTIKRDKNNARAWDACYEWSKEPKLFTPRSLYIFGPVGTGKTLLAACSLKNFVESSPLNRLSANISYINTPEWLEQIRKGFDDDDVARKAESVMRTQLAVMDDIGVENPTDWACERMYLFVNRLYEQEIPAIFTSNCGLDELAGRLNRNSQAGDRIASRLAEMCLQLPLLGSDRRLGKWPVK
jgi:DNA replication protein DnaC